MLRHNLDVLAVTIAVLAMGAIGALAEASDFVVRNLSEQRQQHIERKAELIGRRIEEHAQRLEQQASRIAERAERIAAEHAKRAERIAKVWE